MQWKVEVLERLVQEPRGTGPLRKLKCSQRLPRGQLHTTRSSSHPTLIGLCEKERPRLGTGLILAAPEKTDYNHQVCGVVMSVDCGVDCLGSNPSPPMS